MPHALLFALLSLLALPAMPQADARDVFLVVADGGGSILLIDSERLEPVRRIATSRPLAGPPRFTEDGRSVFFASTDGWIVQYDMRALTVVAEAHAGKDAHGFAVSADGTYIAVANENPPALAILDASLRTLRILPSPSPVAAILGANRRRSFVVVLRDAPELWEVSYDPKAEAIAEGVVHDFRLREGTFVEGFLNPRRTRLDAPLDDAFFLAEGSTVVGVQRDRKKALAIQLDVRRPIASLELPGRPHVAGSSSWVRNGRRMMATPNLSEPILTIVDAQDWKVVANVAVPGRPEFARTSLSTPYVWVGPVGPSGDTLQLIDKESLQAVMPLRPQPGSRLLQLEFDRTARYAFVQVTGALIMFDASTLRQIKHIPMPRGQADK